jgi:hypothetical protein
VEKDSFYRRLGTTSKAKPETIEARFHEQIEKYPKQDYPEQHNKIMEAYIVLGQPESRRGYDIIRKYHYNTREIFIAGLRLVFKKDRTYLDYLNACLMLEPLSDGEIESMMQIQIDYKNYLTLAFTVDYASIKSDNDELIISGYQALVDLAIKQGLEDHFIQDYHPRIDHVRAPLKITLVESVLKAYSVGGNSKEGLALMNQYMNKLTLPNNDEAFILIWWFSNLTYFGETKKVLQAFERLKHVLKTLTDDEVLDKVYDELTNMFNEYYTVGEFTYSYYVTELQRTLLPEHQALKESSEDLKVLMLLEQDFARLNQDNQFPVSVKIDVCKHLYKGFPSQVMIERDLILAFGNQHPDHLEHAAGLMALKKKYPRLYKRDQTDWEEAIAFATKNLSRAEKRQLMKRYK